MTLRFEFYIPRSLKDTDDVKEIENLLGKVESALKLGTSKHIIAEEEEKNLKSNVLWGLAVAKRIRIKQTRKTKSLYPQLVVFNDDKAVTLYPQARTSNEITIKDFLNEILDGEVRCMHEKYEIDDRLGL